MAVKKIKRKQRCQLVAESYDASRILRTKDICEIEKIHRTTLYRWVKSGFIIQPIMRCSRVFGWHEIDYRRWREAL